MSVLSAGAPAKKRPHKFVLGLTAFLTIVIAFAVPGIPWWYYPFLGLLAGTATMIVVVILLWMFGVGGFLVFATTIIGAICWVTLGPVATIALTAGAGYLLWRFRFDIAKRFGVQPAAASSADTSSAAASSQDSNSGTSI
ncbi:hypothetical protein GE253_05015 [Niveispirillum sp. SYP-B3756]|uniref:hypothetical protein n=1 Tax=Niveispirillum sp. SYP-B3756 TaxID=2662178 RepID=UPI001290F176|nr:hypothetical protein [Niveispirillum sp. SYP-B3756]MQP64704.1 hypothetical protein [Niveispirillum sp. SYP-B3756]